VVTPDGFYVSNLLPKLTPRKKGATRRANSIANEGELDHCASIDKDNKDIHEGTVIRTFAFMHVFCSRSLKYYLKHEQECFIRYTRNDSRAF
jgi:hypothetical protein